MNQVLNKVIVIVLSSIFSLNYGAAQCSAPCIDMLNIDLEPTTLGITTLDPMDFYVGDPSCVSSMFLTPATVDCTDDGMEVNLILTVNHPGGGQSTGFTKVIPTDNTPPTILIQYDVTITSDPGVCGKTFGHPLGSNPTTDDNCDSVWPVFVSGIPDGGFYPVGLNTVTWSATDNNNNTTIASYTVTVLPANQPITNTWIPNVIGANSNWANANNWSLATVPTQCHHVVVPNNLPHPIIQNATSAFAHSVTIQADASLSIQDKLSIYNFDGTGLINRGTVDNSGTLIVGTASTINGIGIENYNSITNSSAIEVKSIATQGIVNKPDAIFTNNGFMTLGGIEHDSIQGSGIVNEGTFQTATQLSISNCRDNGITNVASGTFTNSNGLFVSDISNTGIYNLGTISNLQGGFLTIQGTGKNGIWIQGGSFINDAKIIIGNQKHIAYDGIHNRAILTNNVKDSIQIDDTGFGGIANFFGGNISNKGMVSIGNNGGMITHQSIYNSGIFTNLSGATLMLKGGNFSLLNVDIPTAGPGTFDVQEGSLLTVDP